MCATRGATIYIYIDLLKSVKCAWLRQLLPPGSVILSKLAQLANNICEVGDRQVPQHVFPERHDSGPRVERPKPAQSRQSTLYAIYKISQGLVDIPIGQYLKYSRDGVHFQTIYARTKYYEFSFFPRTVAAWNELPSDTLSAPNLAMFKQNIVTINHIMPWAY